MIQITPQMRILVAIEAVDGRKGIDSLARLCEEKLQADPFSGGLLVFRSRRGTSIRIFLPSAEAPVGGEICLVAEWPGTGAPAPGAPGAVTLGGGQSGDSGRAGVAQSKLKTDRTKHLRSD